MQLDSAASRPRPSHAALLLSGDTDSWAADSETSAFHALGHCDGHLAQPRLAPPSVPQPSVGEPRRQTPAPDERRASGLARHRLLDRPGKASAISEGDAAGAMRERW